MAAASQLLAEGANTQAASLEEASASLEEMSSMTLDVLMPVKDGMETINKARLAPGLFRSIKKPLEGAVCCVCVQQPETAGCWRVFKPYDSLPMLRD